MQHFWYNVDFTNGGGSVVTVKKEKIERATVVVEGDTTIVQLSAVPGELKYNLKEFAVKAGTKVKLTFHNPDIMQHNLLVSEPGSLAEIGNQALQMGGAAVKEAAKNAKILFGTKMLDAGQSETLEFVAPDKPGDYVFLCTFPGHFMVMNGIMKVTK